MTRLNNIESTARNAQDNAPKTYKTPKLLTLGDASELLEGSWCDWVNRDA